MPGSAGHCTWCIWCQTGYQKLWTWPCVTQLPKEKWHKFQKSQQRIYGLPKMHKEDTPMKRIVLPIGSASSNLAEYLVRILTTLAKYTLHYVKNSSVVIVNSEWHRAGSTGQLPCQLWLHQLVHTSPYGLSPQSAREMVVSWQHSDREDQHASTILQVTNLIEMWTTFNQLQDTFYE